MKGVNSEDSVTFRNAATPPLIHLLKAMRPQQWVKNVVVFAAPVFAMRFDWPTFLLAGLAFIAFSLVSSSFYLINDVLDAEADRQHPKKRHRPIAAGLVPPQVAMVTAFLCLSVSLFTSFQINLALFTVIALYTVLQGAYNWRLKHTVIIDIMCISAGFVLRALAGAAATDVVPSSWFVLCVGLLALYLAIEKRKAELRAMGGNESTRSVLAEYSPAWLARMEALITPCILMTYALWAIEGSRTPWMLATSPFVMYGIFKYQHLFEQGEGEAPETALFQNPSLWLTILLWGATTIVILLFK